MKDIKFDLIYKSKTTGFHHKKYFLSELMGGVAGICDIHNSMDLIAVRKKFDGDTFGDVELYDGDIVTLEQYHYDYDKPIFPDREAEKFKIEFLDGSFRLIGDGLNIELCRANRFEQGGGNQYERSYGATAYKMCNLKIIGNIYENPAILLKTPINRARGGVVK